MQGESAVKLEQMLEKLKPKARYMSELHVEEYTDSIYKQIINGDIEVSAKREEIGKNGDKNDWEDLLRKKILSKAQKQKQELEHRLGYISNSINSLKRSEQLRASIKSPRSMRESYIVDKSRLQQEEWRKQIKKRQQQIQRKKQMAEQAKKRRIEEEKENQEKRKAEEIEKKKQQILQHMKGIEQRMKKRDQFVKLGNQRYKQVKKQKSMYEKINESFEQKESSILQERKKRLAQIRSFHKPINENQLREHEQKFLQLKRQKQQMRERQRKMNDSRSQSYSSYYEGRFYKQASQQTKNVEENYAQIKAEKMKQFSDHIRDHFVPKIDTEKKAQIQQMIENDKNKEAIRLEKEKQLLQKSKIKGMQNLDFLRSLPKNKKSKTKQAQMVANRTTKGQKIQYQNYLTHRSLDKNTGKQKWNKILHNSKDKETKAIQIQYESQRLEQQLKRKEKHTKYVTGSKQDKTKIDEEYFSMIKAKLDLLKD